MTWFTFYYQILCI